MCSKDGDLLSSAAVSPESTASSRSDNSIFIFIPGSIAIQLSIPGSKWSLSIESEEVGVSAVLLDACLLTAAVDTEKDGGKGRFEWRHNLTFE